MRFWLSLVTVLLTWAGAVHAQGLLIPSDSSLPPLSLVKLKADIAIDEQVATTKVEQTFRNPTDRQLEATYLFPVPKGASVNQFAMWIDGKKVAAEMVKADEARQTYTEIVRRTQDPGLLEYVGNNLMRLRVFPIAAHGDQKVSVSFTSVAALDGSAIEYVYPLLASSKVSGSLESFSIHAAIKSQHGVQNVYSPSHAITIDRVSDHEVKVALTPSAEAKALTRDFQLFYSLGDKDIGLSALTYRPLADEDGHFLMLLSPKLALGKQHAIARDLVLVLDTSGSMQGVKIEQARKALKFCLGNLHAQDRFAVINFSSDVNKYREHLIEANREQVESAQKWVDKLEATGGTAINNALLAALDLRSGDSSRTFTIVFFTDGQPTVGECDPQKIVKNVLAKNTANTRIFTFGVGEADGINATLLDQLAEQTRAVSTFVRSNEDIEAKVSSLYSKISHPVLANLKLTVGPNVQVKEVYPPHLPDLFHGGQLVVLGRYTGHGSAVVKLSGTVGKQTKEFVYETQFPNKTGDDRAFVEHLWARRKVGFLLDEIRANGEKKELVEEVVKLAKKHGIATPYTSYLIVPDGAAPVAQTISTPVPNANLFNSSPVFVSPTMQWAVPGQVLTGSQGGGAGTGTGRINYAPVVVSPQMTLPTNGPATAPASSSVLNTATPGSTPPADYYKHHGYQINSGTAYATNSLSDEEEEEEDESEADAPQSKGAGMDCLSVEGRAATKEALQKKQLYEKACAALHNGDKDGYQAGSVGVELSVQLGQLRNQSQVEAASARRVVGRNCLPVGGVWIDEGFDSKMPLLAVKAMSKAYFRILERHPEMKAVFQLGNRVVWVSPSGKALVIDANNGKEELGDDEIDQLFAGKK